MTDPRLDVRQARAEIRDQRAAVGDGEQLQAAADAQQRQLPSPGGLHQRDLGLVPGRIGTDVVATRQHDRVDGVEEVDRVAGRQDHGPTTGGGDRVDVRRRDAAHRELAPEPGHDVPRPGDADDRAAIHSGYTATTAVTASAMPVR
jgi:hypothetical protein